MVVEPVPSALRKSPPWHMKLGICPAVSQGSADFASRSIHAGVFIETRRGETHDAVELGALVALGPAARALGLAGAELAEVFGRLGDDVLEELKGDAAEGLAWRRSALRSGYSCFKICLSLGESTQV